MALRVARGLFRLWLVLSVPWIGGVGVVAWQNFPTAPAWLTAEEAESESMPPSVSQRLETERWEVGRYASIVTLAPPVFVLALGSALLWAVRGFRQ